jgi:hypothetical protein
MNKVMVVLFTGRDYEMYCSGKAVHVTLGISGSFRKDNKKNENELKYFLLEKCNE